MKMKKRAAAMTLTAVALLLLAGGCSGKTNEAGTVTTGSGKTNETGTNEAGTAKAESGKMNQLQFWNPFTGDDGKYMSEIVDDFNKEYAGKIHVTTQTLASDDYYAKLPVVFSSGTGIPDVIILHVDRIPSFVRKHMIEPMDGDVSKMGLSNKDFIEKTWNAGIQADGKRYTIPLDTHPWLMFYNKSILKELGYTQEDVDKLDKDSFLTMCQKAKDKGYIGMGWYWPAIGDQFFSLLTQFGGSYVDSKNPGTPLFNSESGVKALDFLQDMKNKGLTNEIGADQETLFKQGKMLFCSDGIWANSGMEEIKGLDFGERFFPQIGTQPAAVANSHNLAIMKQPKEDPARREACDTFIKYLSDHSIEWAAGGQVPARLDALMTEEFKKLPWAFTADQLDWFVYKPAVITSGDMDDGINMVLQDFFGGKIKTSKEALQKAEDIAKQKAAITLEN